MSEEETKFCFIRRRRGFLSTEAERERERERERDGMWMTEKESEGQFNQWMRTDETVVE